MMSLVLRNLELPPNYEFYRNWEEILLFGVIMWCLVYHDEMFALVFVEYSVSMMPAGKGPAVSAGSGETNTN